MRRLSATAPAADARFRGPSGIAVAEPGRLVVADTGNALVRIVAAPVAPAAPAAGLVARAAALRPSSRSTRTPLLWPVAPMDGPHEIAGTLGEARGAEGAERFHAGIDVRIDEGTPVLAVRDGVVSHPIAAHDFGSLNESLRIGAGRLRAHPRRPRAPQRACSTPSASCRPTTTPAS